MIVSQLAEFATAPLAGAEAAREVMALSLLDWAACGLAGRDEPVSRILRGLVAGECGAPEAVLIGGGRAPARSAALLNGASSHALDYDDTHFAHIGHPSVAVVPAALAVAQRVSSGCDAFIDACLAGAEASVRVGIWLGRSHYETGFHQTATAGAFGATVAAARLLGLSTNRTEHALGLVSTRASGLKSQFGTMGKPFNAGLAASNGVEAALLAEAGFVSDPAALAGVQGFGPSHAGEAHVAAFETLGKAWLFEEVTHKFHACCHGLHAALEALGSLKTSMPQVEAVEIRTHPQWDRVCNIATPATGLEAKFSYRQVAAMCLAGVSTAALESYSDAMCRDVTIARLRGLVSVSFDETVPETAAQVTVRTRHDTRSASHDLGRRLAMAERREKVRQKARALVGDDVAAGLSSAIDARDLEAFAKLVGG